MTGLHDVMRGKTNKVEAPYTPAIGNGEIVEMMILSVTNPIRYINELKAINKKADEEYEKTGIEGEKKIPTFKEGGMAINVAILNKENQNGIKEDFSDRWETSKYLYPQIVMPDPLSFYAKGWNKVNERRGGHIIEEDEDNRLIGAFREDKELGLYVPEIQDIYPSPTEEAWWDNRTKVKDASLITDEDIANASSKEKKTIDRVLKKEENRKEAWEDLREFYVSLSEDQARHYLALSLSARFLLYDAKQAEESTDGRIQYHLPRPGMRFSVKVEIKDPAKAKYPTYKSHEWFSDPEFDVRGWTYFNHGVRLPNDEDMKLLEEIKHKKSLCFS